MAKNLLAEAIADAKLVKETALANAKITLEETFQPTLQRIVSGRIQEEDGEEEDINIDVNYGEEEDGSGFESFEDEAPAEDEEMPMEGYEEDPELEELFNELDGDDEMEDDMTMEGEEEDWQDPVPDEPIQEEYEDDEDLMEELNRIFEEEGLGDDLDMGPNKEDGAVYTDNPPSGPQFLENKRLQKENKRLRQERNEAIKAVNTLRKTISEVNLLNAKLMYTTKTLRSYNLNESQKERILNSFDRANTVREVKLVYTTIAESFNKRPIKGKVNEGFASKTVKQVNPSKEKLQENNNQIANFARLQELAGIKKIKY